MKKLFRTKNDAPAPIVKPAHVNVEAVWAAATRALENRSVSSEIDEYVKKLSRVVRT